MSIPSGTKPTITLIIHSPLFPQCLENKNGGAKRVRTADLLIANEMLYQLSYGPITK
jgi:hypothetical protein